MRIVTTLLVVFCTVDGTPGRQNGMPSENNDRDSLKGREKRNDEIESPLRVSEREAYLQTDRAYQLPCAVIPPGESVSIVFWMKGKSPDPTLQKLILRHAFPTDGLNFAEDPRYRIAPTYGIIIDPVNSSDSDRYWCKTLRNGAIVEDYLDVTVLNNTFPTESEFSASNVTTFQRHKEDNIVKCPVLADVPTLTDITLYWSVSKGDARNLYIAFAMFPGGERLTPFPNYEAVGINGLAVDKFDRREERYCCHVFEEGLNLRTGCVQVTWLAEAKMEYPSIAGCEPEGQDRCDLTFEPDKDCARLDCSIRDVFPKPALNWSFVDCESGNTPTFVEKKSWTSASTNQTYDTTSRLYIVEAEFQGQCEFTCTAYGNAIPSGVSQTTIFITRITQENTTTAPLLMPTHQADCDCKWGLVVFLTLAMAFLIYLLIIWFILIFPRNRRFIETHINELATFPCQPCREDKAKENKKQETYSDENVVNEKRDSSSPTEDNDKEAPTEESPMLTTAMEERGVSDGAEDGPYCLLTTGESNIQITDSKNKWRPMGEFVTQSALNENNGSGFQAIKDVICAKDGSLFVIDTKGLHRFNSSYNHVFIDLYQTLPDEGYCSVTCHDAKRLLFGLGRGKLVHYDIHTRQTINFGSVTKMKHMDVQLSAISVDDLGFVFAGDRNGQAVSMFDESGGCLTRIENVIEPVFLHAHAHHQSQSLFISSGVVVKKYNIVRSSMNSKILAQVRFTIDAGFLGNPKFHSGFVSVQENTLFVVNHLEVGECLQILEFDAEKGALKNRMIVETPGIRSVRFIDKDRLVVYTDDSMCLFERSANSD